MYLKRFHIEKIKCFDSIELHFPHNGNDFSGWIVLLGGNGTGKSTLLQAIALSLIGPLAGQRLLQPLGFHPRAHPWPDAAYFKRGDATVNLFRLNLEPLCEERRKKLCLVLYLLAQVVNENPVRAGTKDRLREELDPRRPWLGIIRQVFLRPRQYRQLVRQAHSKLPEIAAWTSCWLVAPI
jgi:hypothetical protein